ncbi:hypothetical protein [Alkalicoccobacillus plakortidis]|uniref:LysM domain-containing protein n=1 Tax=Alkalicoccobacillus plakortidis TaxID=444060 RepID=A0ABT0XQ50_9BACI|nr:hypothetical protein [Alkalicoccobacillus plakortidis]MCM2677820.1 hypothetical protein [Alkalicoccobacillus plakortidis]
MKRLFICIALFIVLAGVVADLRTGSLPDQSVKNSTRPVQTSSGQKAIETEVVEETTTEETSQEVIVEPGHTVLSVIEHLHQGPVPVSIQQIIDDFKELNGSLEPDEIQIGKTYLFPIYEKE